MFSGVKTKQREEARALRADEGRSIKEIAAVVGVAVSTVSVWVRDIELTPEQHAALERRNSAYGRQRKGWAANVELGRNRRSSYQEWGRSLARRGLPYAAGCMLYWAEGAKAKHQLQLSNSDPALIAFSVRFLREHFALDNRHLRIKCHLYADHVARQHEVEQFWLDLLGLPRTCLRKSCVNSYSRSSQRKRTNKLPLGTCNVIVSNTRILHAIYGSIQELGGFDRPEWLDMAA
jgi:hypothetical protein